MSTEVELLKAVQFENVGVKTLSLGEVSFVEGKSFTHADYTLDVADSAVINFLFDATNLVNISQVVAEVPVFNASAGPVTIEFYTGTTVSSVGSELIVFNRRGTSSITNEAKLYVAPTITDDGTRFSAILVPATTAVQGDSGSISIPGPPFEVNPAALILIRVTNLNGAGTDIGYRFDWVEN